MTLNKNDFIAAIPHLSEKFTHSMACLVSFESTKRHMTGIYLKKENEKIIAYIFDTTGLSLPGYPCGYRDYSDNRQLEKALAKLSNNGITPAIMPVNTVVSTQNDKFSCLMATCLFFIGMQKNAYEVLEKPGITDSYGSSYFYDGSDNSLKAKGGINVKIYVTTFLPLLIGIQNRLAFLFMMDPISTIDNSFSDIVSIRANWIRKQTKNYDVSFHNYFWQNSYVELLGWFNDCFYKNQAQPFSDFEMIMRQRSEFSSNRLMNPFEIRVREIKANLVVPSEKENLDEIEHQPSVNKNESFTDKLKSITATLITNIKGEEEKVQKTTRWTHSTTGSKVKKLNALKDWLSNYESHDMNPNQQQIALAILASLCAIKPHSSFFTSNKGTHSSRELISLLAKHELSLGKLDFSLSLEELDSITNSDSIETLYNNLSPGRHPG